MSLAVVVEAFELVCVRANRETFRESAGGGEDGRRLKEKWKSTIQNIDFMAASAFMQSSGKSQNGWNGLVVGRSPVWPLTLAC